MIEPTAIRFGRYRLVEQLGAGGMAVIWRALLDGPNGFSREVAIKRIHPMRAGDPHLKQLLATEARLSARLRHPAIVQVYEYGEHDGEPFLSMELVDGVDLLRLMRACVRRGLRPPVGLACFIVRELAGALAYAHALKDEQGRPMQIVHRDVSPSNIMITSFGGVKLLDFGIAKAAAHARPGQTPTQAGRLNGKICYLSPEQAGGFAVDGRSDLFSLGIVFHELLTMQRLFAGMPAFEAIRRVRNAEVPRPSSLVQGVPRDVEAIVMRLVACAPDLRFAGGEELAAALAPIVRRLGGDAPALRGFLAEAAPTAEDDPSLEPSAPTPLHWTRTVAARRRPSRNRLRAVGWMALGAAAFALALSGWAWRSSLASPPLRPPPSPPPPRPSVSSELPSPPPAPAPPARVWLSIAGPDGAAITVDGQPLGALPLSLELPRRAGLRHVEASLPGFALFRADVPAGEDAALLIRLRRRR